MANDQNLSIDRKVENIMRLYNINQKTAIDFKWAKIIHQKKLMAKIWPIAQNTSMEIKLKNYRKMRFLS